MYHFIVNPVSRSGKGLKIWQNKIEPVLKKRNIEYKVEFSKERGDVTKIVSEISGNSTDEEKCTIVILGGDGTVNDAVNGIVDFEKTILAYIPTGSSNDFARDLKISKSIEKNLDKILNCTQPVLMDIGVVETPKFKRRFAVSSGVGFDGAVCQKSVHSILKKRLNKIGLGKLTYLGIALNQIINAPDVDGTIEFDGGEKVNLKKILFCAAMVHKYEGGGFKFCPKADPYDGMLDCIYVSGKSVPGILVALPTAFFGMHPLFPGIRITKFKKAEINLTVPLWLHTDGEVSFKADKLTLSSFEHKLKFAGL